LSQHSAFWNEHQRLPLRGLESLLVTVHKHNQSAAQDAMRELSNGLQSWAVQATQIEANMQRLEACDTIENIAEVHDELIVSEQLKGDVGTWLHGFFQSSQEVNTALKQNSYQQAAALKVVIKALKTRLEFLSSKESAEVQRFGKIAKTWLRLVEKYLDDMLKIQEIPNPYVFGPPLEKGQETFVARPKIDSRIKGLLESSSSLPLLLYGQRRMGKTSLLKNMVDSLPDNFIMLFVDCQDASLSGVENHVSFLYNLARKMIREAKKHYPELIFPPLAKEALESDPFTQFDEWLDDIEQAIGDKKLLLALDEFITLDNAFNQGRLEETIILGLFRNLIQHRSFFRLLLSGTHSFKELQHWASYLINVQTVHLNYLSEEEAEQLIERPIDSFPLSYTGEAIQRVLFLTRHHPALIQLLCREIVQIKDGQTLDKKLLVEVDDVEVAIPAVFESGMFFFTDLERNQMDDNGRTLLRFIASHGEGAIVSREALAAQLSSDLEPTLALLLRRELIEPVDEDAYRFQVELVRRWF